MGVNWITYLLNKALVLAGIFTVEYVGGLFVLNNRIKVNYTRKINHFCLILVPLLVNQFLSYTRTLPARTASLALAVISLALYVKPIRERSACVKTMFLSFDRPEDRPYTLLWLVTQIVAAVLVILPFLYVFVSMGKDELIFIPVLVVGIGDGFAEPVGVAFGKHSYETYALFTDRTYVRTLEGSACVFLGSLLAVLVVWESFTTVQLAAALAVIPPLMTLVEAYSPHTWDTPTLYLGGASSTLAIVTLV